MVTLYFVRQLTLQDCESATATAPSRFLLPPSSSRLGAPGGRATWTVNGAAAFPAISTSTAVSAPCSSNETCKRAKLEMQYFGGKIQTTKCPHLKSDCM